MIDLGAGSGELAILMSKHVGEVIAVEPDQEMIGEGKQLSEKAKVDNIIWQQSRAEDFKGQANTFRLVTIGQALHWMDQQKVLGNVIQLLMKDGGLAVISGRSIWNGTEKWQTKTVEVIKRFLGEERRAGKGTFKSDGRKHEEVIAEIPFARSEVQQIKDKYHWNIKKIIGYLYSTTFATKHLFGDQTEEFERELTRELLKLNSVGEFREQRKTTVIMTWK